MSAEVQVKQLLADSRVAFVNGENETALNIANEARKIEPNNPEVHRQIGLIYLTLKKYEESIKSYSIAAKFDANNGNRYFDLGVAYAAANNLTEAVRYLAKAEELGCNKRNYAKLYHILGMACYELRRFDDALVNFSKEQQYTGVSLELLQRKAVIYVIKNDLRNGIQYANQMKLVSPTSYSGYQIAFNLLKNAKKFDLAKEELEKAWKYAEITGAYYTDCVNLEMEQYTADSDETHLKKALQIIEKSLVTIKPEIKDVARNYMDAAEIHILLENGEQAVRCLNATGNVAAAYNRGFKVVPEEVEVLEINDYILEEMRESAIERIRDTYGTYGIMEMAEQLETNEEGMKDFLTLLENENVDFEEQSEKATSFKLNETEEYVASQAIREHIDDLYYKAYMIMKDYDSAIMCAKRMSSSRNKTVAHTARYLEIEAMKLRGDESIGDKYREAIKCYDRAVNIDPTDVTANSLRMRCLIEVGEYARAERLTALLPQDAREKYLEMIEKAKQGGEQRDAASRV